MITALPHWLRCWAYLGLPWSANGFHNHIAHILHTDWGGQPPERKDRRTAVIGWCCQQSACSELQQWSATRACHDLRKPPHDSHTQKEPTPSGMLRRLISSTRARRLDRSPSVPEPQRISSPNVRLCLSTVKVISELSEIERRIVQHFPELLVAGPVAGIERVEGHVFGLPFR